MISLDGAYDLHVHSAPCLYPRIGDDLTVAAAAQAAGLRGIVLKSHHESTVGRAHVCNHALDSSQPFTVYGSVTLNHAVGGVNPAAVGAALKTGARFVWMPTVDSAAHAQAYGRTGGWHVQGAASGGSPAQPLSILSGESLTPQAAEIVALCQQRDVALATGHLGRSEILALAECARQQGFKRLVITHPIFHVPALDEAALSRLAAWDAWFEFTYCTVSPMWRSATIDETAEAIRLVGVSRSFLTSDGGQTHNPMPHVGLQLLAQMLFEKGIPEADVYRMMVDNPRQIVEA